MFSSGGYFIEKKANFLLFGPQLGTMTILGHKLQTGLQIALDFELE